MTTIAAFLIALLAKSLLVFTTWTVPRTWVPGELVTASMMNTHVRDNFNAVKGFIPTGFSGLQLRTHPNADKAANQIALLGLDEVVMSDGVRYSGLSSILPLTADITASGAGGLDTGSRVASTWYRALLIGKSSTQAASDLRLMLHRAKDYLLDQSQTSITSGGDSTFGTGGQVSFGQGFKISISGPIPFMDIPLKRVGSPVGRVWVEVRSDASGLPSATVLATSDKLDAAAMQTSQAFVRFVFRSPYSVTAFTQYHYVLTGDVAVSGTNYLLSQFAGSNPYPNGVFSWFDGTSWTAVGGGADDLVFRIYVTENDTVDDSALPSGYDQVCHLGWVYNSSGNAFIAFIANDRTVKMPGGVIVSGLTATIPTLTSLATVVPPAPCTFLAALGNGTISNAVYMLSVSSSLAFGQYPAFHTRHYQHSSITSVDMAFYEVPAEVQGVYAYVDAGAGSIYGGGFKW